MIKIDKEFKELIPPLAKEEYNLLEKSILDEGLRDPIVIWNNIIVDGHNRFEICTKHNIKINSIEKSFENRNDVKVWIIQNQFARRNLSAFDRSLLALKLENIISQKAKEKQQKAGGALPQKSAEAPIETRKELAKIANVSHDTIAKVKKIEEKATTEQKEKLRKGEESIHKIYSEIRQVSFCIWQFKKELRIKQRNPILL
jgi:hypothetical protein